VSLGLTALLAFAPLAGLPLFDTTLVVISRYRRGAPILSGGRDHLTHRLFEGLGSERSVAIVLAVGQSLLVLLALGLRDLSPEGVVAATAGYLLAGAVALALLEGPLLTGAPEEQTT
jgi:UDP-GlcNAc:undecaprenyl-phosphate/decaprenyl-phosphate GlcNAc-1-phosphate transferase